MGAEPPAIAKAWSHLDRWRNADITKEGRAEKGGALKLATKEQQAAQGENVCCTCVTWAIYTLCIIDYITTPLTSTKMFL